jgi:hypothetical protein
MARYHGKKFVIAAYSLGVFLLALYLADERYENILPYCAKYEEVDFFWICHQRSKLQHCDKATYFTREGGCVVYDNKTMCGSFSVEKAQSFHCVDWRPWFNRKLVK